MFYAKIYKHLIILVNYKTLSKLDSEKRKSVKYIVIWRCYIHTKTKDICQNKPNEYKLTKLPPKHPYSVKNTNTFTVSDK